MYPQVPGRAELVLASPQFPAITISRGNGVIIDITAPNASDSVKYVQGLTVNGTASNRAWLPESVVTGGGTLAFTLGSTPNTAWGSAAADAPPSFDVGPVPPRTGAISGLAGKCVDVKESGTTNGTAVQLYDCNNTGAQTWRLP